MNRLRYLAIPVLIFCLLMASGSEVMPAQAVPFQRARWLIGVVPEDETVVVSTNRGQPVALDGKSRAGLAFQDIARRLSGEEVPFMSLEEKDGFFGRIGRLIRSGGN